MRYTKAYIYVIVMSLIVVIFPTNIISADTTQTGLSMKVTPEESIFNIENMKPGDWAPRPVVISNAGDVEFEYYVDMHSKGPEKLFNELMLEISAHDIELYNGKLAEFTSLAPRTLEINSEEELQMTVHFPDHLGNDFQGLDTHFSLLFTAEGDRGQSDSVSVGGGIGSSGDPQKGSLLPATATNFFNLVLIGALSLILGGLLLTYKRLIKDQGIDTGF